MSDFQKPKYLDVLQIKFSDILLNASLKNDYQYTIAGNTTNMMCHLKPEHKNEYSAKAGNETTQSVRDPLRH